MQPFPLFSKIEATFIAELKKRFAGTQATRAGAAQPTPSAASPAEIQRLEKEVEAQVIAQL